MPASDDNLIKWEREALTSTTIAETCAAVLMHPFSQTRFKELVTAYYEAKQGSDRVAAQKAWKHCYEELIRLEGMHQQLASEVISIAVRDMKASA